MTKIDGKIKEIIENHIMGIPDEEIKLLAEELLALFQQNIESAVEDYRCKVTQGILSQLQENVRFTEFINDLENEFFSATKE